MQAVADFFDLLALLSASDIKFLWETFKCDSGLIMNLRLFGPKI